MSKTLRIGEFPSLGTLPYFFPLRHVFNEPNWEFVTGQPDDLAYALANREVDVALAPPLALANTSIDYLVLPDLGYAGRAHVKDILLFSDILLDDMDEMTMSLQDAGGVALPLMQIVLGHYLRYQTEFIMGWGNAESFLLVGDPALRERLLARYAYVYDVGDLWRHYTGKGMIYYMWIVRKDALKDKEAMVVLFHRLLKQALKVSRSDWNRLIVLAEGYEWLKKSYFTQLWKQIDYELLPAHFDGLNRFYEDCLDFGFIEEIPEIEFFDHD